jgi:hypothetical protein
MFLINFPAPQATAAAFDTSPRLLKLLKISLLKHFLLLYASRWLSPKKNFSNREGKAYYSISHR